MAGIKPKYGTCGECGGENKLLYRRKPPECGYCYQKNNNKRYAERRRQKATFSQPKRVKRIPQVSKTNKITTSTGEIMSRAEFDNRIKRAKAKRIQINLDKYGYIVCEDCKRNDCKPIDCSHDKSVKECIEQGVAELAYDVENITMRGRKCHNIHDGTT